MFFLGLVAKLYVLKGVMHIKILKSFFLNKFKIWQVRVIFLKLCYFQRITDPKISQKIIGDYFSIKLDGIILWGKIVLSLAGFVFMGGNS